jgi:malate dehydrogenase (oxaloacetate-decarboxylating)(NADP+)
LNLSGCEVIEPERDERYGGYVESYFRSQNRRGVTLSEARREVGGRHIFANMMVASGDADGLISGVDRHYPAMVKPILNLIGLRPGVSTAAGMYLVYVQNRLMFFADTAINISLTSEELASIAVMAAEFALSMNVCPRIAMLSFSNFGSVRHPLAKLVRRAKELVEERAPQLKIDGEMQADTAVVEEILNENYPFCTLGGPANVLVFPDMQSGNIAYKLLQRLGGARVIGPVILGLNAPAYVMQRHASVDEIFNMITVASAQAAMKARQSVAEVPRAAPGMVSNI